MEMIAIIRGLRQTGSIVIQTFLSGRAVMEVETTSLVWNQKRQRSTLSKLTGKLTKTQNMTKNLKGKGLLFD